MVTKPGPTRYVATTRARKLGIESLTLCAFSTEKLAAAEG